MQNEEYQSDVAADGAEASAFSAINWACTLPPILDDRGTSDIPLRLLALVMAKHADGDTGKNCFPALTTLQQMTTLSQTTLRKLLKRGVEAGLWVKLDKKSRFGTDWYELQLGADLEHHGDKVSDQITRRKEKDKARAAAYRARQAEKLKAVTPQTSVTGDERHARIDRDVTQGSSVRHAATDHDVTQRSTVRHGRPCGEPSLDLPRVDQPAHVPALGGSAAKASVRTPARETLAKEGGHPFDVFEHEYPGQLQAAWAKYETEVIARGYSFQPKYAREIQTFMANALLHGHEPHQVSAALQEILHGRPESDGERHKPAAAPWDSRTVQSWLPASLHSHRMFGPGGASQDTIDECVLGRYAKPKAINNIHTPEPAAQEVAEVPLQRGANFSSTEVPSIRTTDAGRVTRSHNLADQQFPPIGEDGGKDQVSTGLTSKDTPSPQNALAAMRERLLGKAAPRPPKTEQELETDRLIQESAAWDREFAAMSPAAQEAHTARMRQMAGDMARESRQAQERAAQEAQERNAPKRARRESARAASAFTVAS